MDRLMQINLVLGITMNSARSDEASMGTSMILQPKLS